MASLSLHDLPDHTLVSRSLDGDSKAFQILLQRYTGMMISYAYRITNSRAEAEDAVQEAFITAWQQMDKLQDYAKVKSWLMRVVSHKAIDLMRRRDTNTETIEEILPDNNLGPAGQAEVNQQMITIENILNKLPATQKQCWILREIGGYSYKEIAIDLDLPVSTVRGNIARARSTLLSGLEDWK